MWQLLIAAGIAAAGFGAGWATNGWRHDSVELAARTAADAAIKAAQAKEATVADQVEKQLAQLKTSERVIDRGVVKEIRTNETVYRSVCLPDTGRLLVNAAAAGTDPDSVKPPPAVPGNAAGPR